MKDRTRGMREIPRYVVELTAEIAGANSVCQQVLDASRDYKRPRFYKDGCNIIVVDDEEQS